MPFHSIVPTNNSNKPNGSGRMYNLVTKNYYCINISPHTNISRYLDNPYIPSTTGHTFNFICTITPIIINIDLCLHRYNFTQ